jgi:Fe-S-cluster containining protein
MPDAPDNSTIIERLCLNCGLCCDGTIFADVRLRNEAEAARLKRGGLRPKRARSQSGPAAFRIPQPCAALGADCRCAVYEDRPGHCARFECLLFQEVAQGAIQLASAQRVVRKARHLRDQARELMDTLTDAGEDQSLRERFLLIAEMLEDYEPDEETLAAFSDLTMAWQDLSCLLSERFYR